MSLVLAGKSKTPALIKYHILGVTLHSIKFYPSVVISCSLQLESIDRVLQNA